MSRILVVEDTPVDQQMIIGLLKKHDGWEIELASNGVEALETIPDLRPHIIVTDLRMPEMDGLQLVQEVRQRFPEIPIVLVTSFGSEQIAIEALRAGATSYSPKQSLATDLVATVENVLEITRRMRYTHDTRMLPAPRQVAFVLGNDLTLIGPAIEHVQSNLPDWSQRDRLQIGMALGEALVNAMHHGNLEVESSLKEEDGDAYEALVQQRRKTMPYSQRRVHVEAEFSQQHICVQVSDEGPGFSPGDVADPSCEENLHKISGRGLFLIRSFMDQVAHNQTGNQITLTKLRQEEQAAV